MLKMSRGNGWSKQRPHCNTLIGNNSIMSFPIQHPKSINIHLVESQCKTINHGYPQPLCYKSIELATFNHFPVYPLVCLFHRLGFEVFRADEIKSWTIGK